MAENGRHEYELVYILHPDMDEEGILALNERLGQIVQEQQGEVTTTELWGRRTLAYPIQKHFEGHYVLHRFLLPPEATGEIDRFLRLNENVLRHLMLRLDK
ncbi:30S ribosomal protein S6 [Litorilinea aerophila]|uniref:Small ribosomal subunit protein bS6 n=1 Tax=Litorilinea aerophila TaxID=1204385 RepID=A0A540VKE0_9CHLR|nr:30S ribosomal protein S6 [Litorilinea aerophila]MCC9075813.1 30S ribosomal protein S6 [Litorilinea aerophila]OUC09175.1 hypothetical protein RY27_04475 [Litorilinea aerophila]GIV77260.1 MAG: 30S ribosomal protein S6 [Litorilinea sp.]